MARQKTAIIIGAGVVGITTAYELARRGWQVTLVDKETGPGMGASHSNGAQLSYCYTDALASPSLLKMLPRNLLGGSGLGVTWSASPSFAFWLARFLRNCTKKRFEENTLTVLDLARRSQAEMAKLLAAHPIEFGRRTAGKLHLYYSHAELQHARAVMALKRLAGCEQLELSVDEATAAEPFLRQMTKPVLGAISTPCEEVGDAYAFCCRLHDVLGKSYGMVSVFGQRVVGLKGVDTDEVTVHFVQGQELHADMVVICAASASRSLVAPQAGYLPIWPMKGYSFEMPLMDNSPSVSLTDTRRRIVIANLGDRLRVAGLADLGNWDARPDPEISEQLVGLAKQSFPGAGDYDLASNHWAGLRPMTPNSQPIISRPQRSLAINTGHGMLGWTLAMGSADVLAETIA